MKKAAVAATFAVLVVVGHASCEVAAQDDLPEEAAIVPEEAAIVGRRILAVDDGRESPLTDQPFTPERGVGALVFDAFEQDPSERSLPTRPMVKTEEALARVAAEADLSDEETTAEQRLLGRDEEGKRLVMFQPSTSQIDVEALLISEFDPSGVGEAGSVPVMLGASKQLVGREEAGDRFAAYRPFTRELGAEAVISDWFDNAPSDSTMPTVAIVEPRRQRASVATEDHRPGEAAIAEQGLLGSDDEDDRFAAYQPFTREIGVDGIISASFDEAMRHVGVTAATMLEAKQALATAIDLGRDVQRGDRFYVRYERTFTAAGAPIGIGRVMWAELRTKAKGTVAIYRFRSRDKTERFWRADGQAATPPSMRLPLETVSVSSGFGLRADPFDQPPPVAVSGKPAPMGGPKHSASLPPGLPTGGVNGNSSATVNMATPLGATLGLVPYGNWQAAPRAARSMFMHEGIDLVAPVGTAVYAAADGVVVGAEPNGRYGNWIRIEHGQKLATGYGHLMAFAPAIHSGKPVVRGELIGFVGSTGRSTGAHLHFEVHVDGKPVNPITSPELKALQLRGLELERFRKQVAASVAEREREARVGKIGL